MKQSVSNPSHSFSTVNLFCPVSLSVRDVFVKMENLLLLSFTFSPNIMRDGESYLWASMPEILCGYLYSMHILYTIASNIPTLAYNTCVHLSWGVHI